MLGCSVGVVGFTVGGVGGTRTARAVVGWMSAVRWFVVVVVGRLCTMLLPQTLSFLVASCRAVTEMMAVAASPTFYSLVLLTL